MPKLIVGNIMKYTPHMMLHGIPFWFYPLDNGSGVDVRYHVGNQLIVSNDGSVKFTWGDPTEHDTEIMNYFREPKHQRWVFEVAQNFKRSLLNNIIE